MRKTIERLEKAAAELHISLTDTQKEHFIRYYELLIEWNKEVNLTNITKPEEVIDKHFIDSLSIVKVIDLKDQKLIDIGTGAGFPGIPIKIVFPEMQIVLLDSLQKRVTFLETVIHELGLEDIKAVHGRAEDLAKTLEYREIFDICVSRAVANLAVLSEFCIPFVREGGDFISYKAETASEEIEEAKKAIDLLGGKYEKTVSMKLPFTEYGRNLILIHKCDTTNSKYPRKAGIPIKRPLV